MNELIKYIGIIAGAITGLTVICQFLKSVIEKGFKPIYKKIEDLDENQCKEYGESIVRNIYYDLRFNGNLAHDRGT